MSGGWRLRGRCGEASSAIGLHGVTVIFAGGTRGQYCEWTADKQRAAFAVTDRRVDRAGLELNASAPARLVRVGHKADPAPGLRRAIWTIDRRRLTHEREASGPDTRGWFGTLNAKGAVTMELEFVSEGPTQMVDLLAGHGPEQRALDPERPGVANFVVRIPLGGDKGRSALGWLDICPGVDGIFIPRQLAGTEGWASAGFVEGREGRPAILTYVRSKTGIDWRVLPLSTSYHVGWPN